jgi:hypothetical protein
LRLLRQPLEHANIDGCFLAADATLMNDEYKNVFENFSFLKNMPALNDDNILDILQLQKASL